ncbi:Mevalonate kinase [Elsinoe australis]|uniref:Mevalonate kinase n=1 Tax=Elsinoe australis TaxID=40998 RepID=A0A2P8AFN9_9PEZI|nr:Mevalonate kinase [Elsinoe australis]
MTSQADFHDGLIMFDHAGTWDLMQSIPREDTPYPCTAIQIPRGHKTGFNLGSATRSVLCVIGILVGALNPKFIHGKKNKTGILAALGLLHDMMYDNYPGAYQMEFGDFWSDEMQRLATELQFHAYRLNIVETRLKGLMAYIDDCKRECRNLDGRPGSRQPKRQLRWKIMRTHEVVKAEHLRWKQDGLRAKMDRAIRDMIEEFHWRQRVWYEARQEYLKKNAPLLTFSGPTSSASSRIPTPPPPPSTASVTPQEDDPIDPETQLPLSVLNAFKADYEKRAAADRIRSRANNARGLHQALLEGTTTVNPLKRALPSHRRAASVGPRFFSPAREEGVQSS